MQRLSSVALSAAVALLVPDHALALTIVRHFVEGAPPPNQVGGGNLVDIFNAAADRWEMAIRDRHIVVLHFGWSGVGCLSGEHSLIAQGGTPHRETEGTIFFDNLGFPLGCPTCPCADWYMDPTPYEHEEFADFVEQFQDAGGGPVSVTRMLSTATGDASTPNMDLFSVALHEIGHALGLSMGNSSFAAESVDLDIDVLSPRPLPGTTIPLATNHAGVTSHIDSAVYFGPIMAAVSVGSRRFLTGLDILANAQLSGFLDLDLDPPDPLIAGAGRVPDGALTVTSEPGGDITLSWQGSCSITDGDYAIYEGILGGSFQSHTARFCTTGGATTMTFSPGHDSSYYLVVPRNLLREGSYGADSTGVERPPGIVACRPRLLAGCP